MKCKTLELKPTQFAVGMREVQVRAARLKGFGDNERHEYLHEHPVLAVQAADEQIFIIDRHHFVRACWELGVHEIPVEVKADFSHLKGNDFWEAMQKAHWSHFYDQFGFGPHEPRLLPEDVRGLADDPHRSLAWAVRREGGYTKTEEPFSEFKWADYFRKKLVIEPGDDGFKKAIKAAVSISRLPECKDLPGFISSKGSAGGQ